MIEAFLHAAGQIADPTVMAVIFFGSLFGLILGLMPGLGAVQGLALALPFTFGWDPLVAMFFYAGIMGSVSEGGAVTAILLNTPGTPINAASCFDGYPMARRGEAGRALGLAAASSALGALFGIIVLIALIPLVRPIVLSFGPPEFFWLILFGLVTITFAARGNLFKGLAAGGVGILVSLVGYRDLFNVTRWTGGSEYLWEGVPLVPFFIGVFAISELIIYTTKGGTIARVKAERIEVKGMRQVFQGVREMFDYPVTFLRGSVIGTIVGIIPGIGGAVANFISYTSAMQASKNPALFGQGNPEGLVASESANDAKDGGSLLPTLAFGIPGSVEMAVFLGALILHGVQPGPLSITIWTSSRP
jgi:putative tricarboxylic transport membrane protein